MADIKIVKGSDKEYIYVDGILVTESCNAQVNSVTRWDLDEDCLEEKGVIPEYFEQLPADSLERAN